jgi:hypothetical protein
MEFTYLMCRENGVIWQQILQRNQEEESNLWTSSEKETSLSKVKRKTHTHTFKYIAKGEEHTECLKKKPEVC